MLKTCCGLDLDVAGFIVGAFYAFLSVVGFIISLVFAFSRTKQHTFKYIAFAIFFAFSLISNALVLKAVKKKTSSPLIMWLLLGVVPSCYLMGKALKRFVFEGESLLPTQITLTILFFVFQWYIWFVMFALYRSLAKSNESDLTCDAAASTSQNSIGTNQLNMQNVRCHYDSDQYVTSIDRNIRVDVYNITNNPSAPQFKVDGNNKDEVTINIFDP